MELCSSAHCVSDFYVIDWFQHKKQFDLADTGLSLRLSSLDSTDVLT